MSFFCHMIFGLGRPVLTKSADEILYNDGKNGKEWCI